MKTYKILYMPTLKSCLIFLVSVYSIKAQKWHSDNNNGTYTNPVIVADYPVEVD